MAKTKQEPTRGVAPKRATSPERVSIAARLSRPAYDEMALDAKITGRSLSEEIEQRLIDSVKYPGVIGPLFGSTAAAVDLFKSLSQALTKVQSVAKENGLDELETRRALKAAYDHIGKTYFWDGESEIPIPDGYLSDPTEPAKMVCFDDFAPEAMGYAVARITMGWNGDELDMDTGALVVSNHWTGNGETVLKQVESEGAQDQT